MTLFEKMRSIGPASSWQIVAPADYHDRMAQEGAPAVPPGGYPLTDHGGSTIPNPELAIIYLGAWWGDKARIELFAKELMEYGYLKPLEAYGSGNGTFIGGFQGPAVAGTVTDAQLQQVLRNMIAAGQVPAPNGHRLYAMFTPEGVTVQLDANSFSCKDFCGYHSALDDQTFYSVQPSSSCGGCHGSNSIPDAFTMVLAHEVAEACTDAFPGKGWVNDETGMENADQYAWIPGPYGQWVLQGYQVNGVGNSLLIIKYTPPAVPQPTDCKSRALAIMDSDIATVQAGHYLANGEAWLSYARQTLDFYLGNNAALPTTPKRLSLFDRLKGLL